MTPDSDNATHIVQVVGGSAGVAYVGWLADNSPAGYAQYLRPFSITRGWLSDPLQVSQNFGNRLVWPGDTIGLSTLPAAASGSGQFAGRQVVVSWGSATANRPMPPSEIFAAVVSFP